MEAIKNRMEGQEEASAMIEYTIPEVDQDLTIDFIDTTDLAQIDAGIRAIEKTNDTLAVVQGVAILKAESLWDQSDSTSLAEFRKAETTRWGIDKTMISRRRKMAYAWLDHQKILKGVKLTTKSNHLLYLDDALELHKDKRAVLEHFKKDSFRDWRAWATGNDGKKKASDLPPVEAKIQGGKITIDGTPVLSIEKALPPEEAAWLTALLREAYKARKGNLVAYVVPLYQAGEGRVVDRALKEHRIQK